MKLPTVVPNKKQPQTADEANDIPKVSKGDRWLARFGYFSLGLIAVAVGFVLYWSFTGNDVLQVQEPVKVVPLVVASEKSITLKVDFCKTVASEGRVIRRLVSSQTEIFAPTKTEALGTGCHTDYPIEVPLPEQAVPGTYYVNYRVTYKTNPFKTVTEEFNSEKFEIVSRDDSRLVGNITQ